MASSKLKNAINKAKEKHTEQQTQRVARAKTTQSYQKVAQPVEDTTRSVVGKIALVKQKDPVKAQTYQEQLNWERSQPGSKFYDPFTQPTNKAFGYMTDLGVDMSDFDGDAWFERNAGMKNYINTNNNNNNVKSLTKKSSVEEKLGYNFDQLWDAQDDTNNALKEQDDLWKQVNFLVNDGKNWSDDQIVNNINANLKKDYPTIYKMRESAKAGQPIELNSAIDLWSDDDIYAAIWMARNPDADVDLYTAMANSYNGVGNTWQYDPEIDGKLIPNTLEFKPYSVAATGEEPLLYFGMPGGVSREWVASNQNRLQSADPKEVKMMEQINENENNTQEAETALEALWTWMKANAKSRSPEDAKKKFDDVYDKGYVTIKVDGKNQKVDISILKKMDKTMGQVDPETGEVKKYATGDLVGLNRPVDYKYNDMLSEWQQMCSVTNQSGTQIVNDAGKEFGVQPTTEQEAAVVAEKDKQIAENTELMDDVMTQSESNTAQKQGSASYFPLKNFFDLVRSTGIFKAKDWIQQTKAKEASNLSSAMLQDADIANQYQIYSKAIPDLQAKKAELEAQLGNLVGIVGAENTAYDVALSVDQQPGWNVLSESHRDTLLQYQDIYNPEDLENLYRSYLEQDAGELTEDETAALNAYRDVVNSINDAQAYIDANQATFDAAVERTQKAKDRYDAVVALMKRAGIDTTEMEQTAAVSEFLLNFTQYSPTEWREYSVYHEYSKAIHNRNDRYEDIYKLAQASDTEITNNLELSEWLFDYAERNGIQIPDSIRENLLRWQEKLQREHEDFEYLSYLTVGGFGEGVAKGRAMAMDIQEFDWDNYKNTANIEEQPGWKFLSDDQKAVLQEMLEAYDINDVAQQFNGFMEQMDIESKLFGVYRMRDLLTDYEKDIFYYLLGTEGMQGANAFIDHLTDADYGVLNSRAAEKTKQSADDLAEQGFWGRRAADALSMILSPVAALGSFAYVADVGLRKLRGERVEFNPKNVNLTANIYKKEARAKINEEIIKAYGEGTVLQKFMSTLQEIISNRGDSLVNAMAFGPLFSGISNEMMQEFFSAMPMAFSAATDAVADAKEKGASDTQLLGIFAATLLAESVTEAVSIDNIKEAFKLGANAMDPGSVKDFLKNWLTKSGISEMVGESVNDVIENLADEICMGDSSEYAQLVIKYMNEDHMTREDAKLAARRDQVMGVLHTALVSYLSPGLDIGSYAVGKFNYYRSEAKKAQKGGNAVSIFDIMKRDKAIRGLIESGAIEEAMATPEAPVAPEAPQTTTEEIAPDEGQAPVEEPAPVQGRIEVENAPEPEASVAVSPEEQAAQAANTDYNVLSKAKGEDQKAQTAAVASVLDTEKTDESNDRANAAAANMEGMLNVDPIEFMQDMVTGANSAGIDPAIVKMAVTNAALGGELSMAWQVMQTTDFIHGDLDTQAALLAGTVQADAENADLQTTMAKAVYENRVQQAMTDIMLNGTVEKSRAAQKKADDAAKDTQNAKEQLEDAQSFEQAQNDKAKSMNTLASENPTNENVDNARQANADLRHAAAETDSMAAGVPAAEERQAEAESEASRIKEQEMAVVRQQAEQRVAEEDTQRNEAKAQIAEQQRQADEAAAKAQAEEDEKTGVAQERREDSMIEAALDNEGVQGEERDQRREELSEQRDKVKANKVDLNGKVNNTEGFLAISAFGRKLGIRFEMADMPFEVRGKYENGVVYLNQNRIVDGSMTVGQAMVEAALHEITHSMENTGAYKNYRSVVLDALFGKVGNTKGDAKTLYDSNAKFRAQVDTIINERAKAGDKNFLGDDQTKKIQNAEKEIIADFARTRLSEKEIIERFMDAGMGGNMRNALHNANQALRNYFGKMTGQERQEAEYLRRAERAFQKAMNDVAKTEVHPEASQFSIMQVAQATGMRFDADKLELYNKDGKLIDGVKTKITTDDMVKTPVGFLIRTGLDMFDGKNAQQAAETKDYIDPTSTAGKALDMMTGLMNMIARYKQSDLVWEIGASTLSSTFSALKKNADKQYGTTVDFGTICAKTQAIIDVMSKVMLDKIDPETGMIKEGMKPGLTRTEIMKVYDATHNAKLSVPCPVCYVFSRWMGVPSLLGQMSQFQKNYVVTQRDANGKAILDENGRPVVDWDATQEKVNDYLYNEETGMLVRYKDKDAVNDRKTALNNKMKSLEEKQKKLQERLYDKDVSKEEKAKIKEQIDGVLDDMVNVENELGEVRAYNWIDQALCKGDGKFQVDRDNFRVTPDAILFDLNRTSEFAEDAKNWRFRNTRGAGMGKAIMPYSGETIGDILYGTDSQKKKNRQAISKNPWINYIEGGKNSKAVQQLRNARNRAKQQNMLGGQRLQSTSDFRPEWGLDYIMSFLELQAAGSKVQMYTKVAEAVDFFASVGADVNLSIMGKGTGWHEATAEELAAMSDEEKSVRAVEMDDKVYLMDFSDTTGMRYYSADPTVYNATTLKNKHNNVQMILVGMNDTHIRLALRNSNIDFIIPWHSSGNSKEVLSGLISSVGESLDRSVDYTTTQSDMKKGETKSYYDENGEKVEYTMPGEQTEDEKKLWDLRVRILTGKADNKVEKGGLTAEERKQVYEDPWLGKLYDQFYRDEKNAAYHAFLSGEQAKQIFPFEYWNTKLTKDKADENGKRFVKYCERMGVVPRFSQFKDDPGYWKLLIDRPMYNLDGTYHEQQVINVTNARIGELNESGKLDKSTTDLPTQAQAAYAPKDKRSPMYKEYKQREANAVKAADEALGIPYTEKQMDAMQDAEAIQDAQYDLGTPGQQSVYGDMTEADRQLMEDAARDYQDAVARGDMEAAQQDVESYAESKGYSSEMAYHGTTRFGFTEFDMDRSSGHIFVAFSDRLSSTYTQSGKGRVRNIREDASSYHITYDPDNPEQIMQPILDGERVKYKSGTGFGEGWHNIKGVTMLGPNEYQITLSTREQFTLNGEELAETINRTRDIQRYGFGGIYKLYTRPGNQLVVDADGANWNDIAVPWKNSPQTTRMIAEYAQAKGYDSVRINNVWDSGGTQQNRGDAFGDIGIFFNQKDVKSADTITYDNQGNMIPLNQRFTDSPDIRWSTDGEMTEADRDLERQRELNQSLINAGVVSQPEVAAYEAGVPGPPNTLPGNPIADEGGNAQRQFGRQTAQTSDALHQEVRDYLYTHSSYTPDSNQAQIDRAIGWVQAHASESDPDGYYASLREVESPDFDYRSADGQARMLTMMSMAALRYEAGNQSALSDELRLADAFNKQGTDLGRQLQARKIFRLMTPVGRMSVLQGMADQINESYDRRGIRRTVRLSDWTLQAAAAAQTEEDFQKAQDAAAAELAEQMPATWKEKLVAWRMLSMLGNVRTHGRNILGNLIFMPAVGLKNKIGAGLEAAFIHGDAERTKVLGFASEEARAFAKEDVDTVESILRGEEKYKEGNQVERNRKAFGQGKGIVSKTAGQALQWLIDFNGNMLEKEDWVFLKRHYRNALASYMTANKLTAADMTGKTLEAARAYAIQEAKKATYRDANSVIDGLNRFEQSHPAVKFVGSAILPFKKTPANILKRGVEYSPVGLINAFTRGAKQVKQWSDYQNGKLAVLPDKAISPTQFIDKIASGLSGTAIMALGAILAKMGAVRAGFDDDDEFDKLQGEQEYSLNPGKLLNSIFHTELFGEDVSYTVDWAAPVCMPFFVGATIMNEYDKLSGGDIEFGDVLDAIMGIPAPVFNLSMLDGVNSLLKSTQNLDAAAIVQVGEKVLTNYASSYVPTLVGQAARTIDTTRRKAYVESGADLATFRSALEQVENKLPWLSMTNIPYRNVWGETDTSDGWEAAFENFLSPGYISHIKDDPVTNELKRLYQQTGEKAMIPKAAGKSISVEGETIKLNAEQYDQYVVDRGQTAHKALEDLMNSPLWQVCDDPTRAMMVSDAWTYANQIARHNLDKRGKKDAWVANAEANNDLVNTIVDRAAEKNRKDYIAGYGQSLAEALDNDDSETAELSMTALESAEATNAQVKAGLRDYFKPLYQQAYEAKDEDRMGDIESILSDYDFDSNDFEGWLPGEEKEWETETRWLRKQ